MASCKLSKPMRHGGGMQAHHVRWVSRLAMVVLLLMCVAWSVQHRLPASSKALRQPTAEELELIAKPIVVAVKTSHFFGGSFSNRNITNCSYKGAPLTCIWKTAQNVPAPEADGLWFHIPTHSGTTQKDSPHQLTIGMSMESAAYYPALDNPNVMNGFDIEMTYRLCSHITVPYYFGIDVPIHSQDPGFKDPLPWKEKISAIVYINSNCGALNGRNEIVKKLMNTTRLPVHAHGNCLNTHPHDQRFDKVSNFRKYKFCIAMENSNSQDYVTEKIWNAFEAGCLPIYLGAPNIKRFVPHHTSFIDYRDFDGPEGLMDFLERLNTDQAAYEAYMAWKYMPVRKLNPEYVKALELYGSPVKPMSRECQLCQLLMGHRLHPLNFTNTHCLHNKEWLAEREQDRLHPLLPIAKTHLIGGRRGEAVGGVI